MAAQQDAVGVRKYRSTKDKLYFLPTMKIVIMDKKTHIYLNAAEWAVVNLRQNLMLRLASFCVFMMALMKDRVIIVYRELWIFMLGLWLSKLEARDSSSTIEQFASRL